MSGPWGVRFEGGRRRRHLADRRRALAVLLAIALLAGAGASLALSTGRQSSTGGVPSSRRAHRGSLGQSASPSSRPHSPAQTGSITGERARGRAAAGFGYDARSIRHVLTYTPFLVAGSRRHRLIALTFDDGPSPFTPAIVSILVGMHVPGTFFVVGQQLRYFAAGMREELRHGFEVGDHTLNHAWLPHLSPAGQSAQIAVDAGELRRFGAPGPLLFRPPYGAYDRVTLGILRQMHMLMVMWSIDPADWRRPGAAVITRSVLAAARPGAVVIMHDGGGDRTQTVAALPRIIRGLRRRHYDLVSVAQLLALDPPPRHQRLPSRSAA